MVARFLSRLHRPRPRIVRPPARASLRLESLEARANPSAPAITGVSADWTQPGVVVITGQVIDETPQADHVEVGGAATGTYSVDGSGEFTLCLKTTGTGPLYFRAVDSEALASANSLLNVGDKIPTPLADHPTIKDVEIYQDENGWHVRGHVNGGGIGTIIRIVKGPGDSNGQTGAIDDDGSFDIIINMPPESSGGGISIIAENPDGSQSDQWDGLIG